MRTPEEIHRYGKDVIEKHCHNLFSLNNGSINEIIDENNQAFRISDYRDWKYDVIDFIKNHDQNRIHEIKSLFHSFEILFTPDYLSEIIGILSSSINNLRRKENSEGTNNPQKAQATNEPEPTGENPSKEKKKVFNWKRVLYIVLFIVVIVIIIGAIIYYFDKNIIAVIAAVVAAIATIIGTIFAALSYYKQ